MGYSRKDVEATKKMAKKFVRYQEGAELLFVLSSRGCEGHIVFFQSGVHLLHSGNILVQQHANL